MMDLEAPKSASPKDPGWQSPWRCMHGRKKPGSRKMQKCKYIEGRNSVSNVQTKMVITIVRKSLGVYSVCFGLIKWWEGWRKETGCRGGREGGAVLCLFL